MFRTTTEESKKETKKEREIDSRQLDATGLFPSPVWLNQWELWEPSHPPLSRRDSPAFTKPNMAAQRAQKRQFLVFYTTAYTVQSRTGGAGAESCESARKTGNHGLG